MIKHILFFSDEKGYIFNYLATKLLPLSEMVTPLME